MSRSIRPLAAVAALGVLLTGCSTPSDTKAESSSAAGSTSAAFACPDGGLKFGIEPYEDPAKLEPAYKTLAASLSTKLNCPVNVQIVEDYSAEVLAMRNKRLDIGQFGPLGFVFASQKADAQPLVSFGDAQGQLTSYTAGIWVPADSPIRSIEDLKGKSLALGSVGSTSGDALPRYAMKKAGLDETSVKSNYAGGHTEALLALVNKTVDAAELNSQTLATAKREGKFDESKFRQIWKSEPIPNDPITVRGSLDEATKTAIKDALTSLPKEDVAKVGEFLDVTPPGPLVPVTKETYQPLFDLAATMNLSEKDV